CPRVPRRHPAPPRRRARPARLGRGDLPAGGRPRGARRADRRARERPSRSPLCADARRPPRRRSRRRDRRRQRPDPPPRLPPHPTRPAPPAPAAAPPAPPAPPPPRPLHLPARRRDRALALPDRLVRAFAEARSRSLAAWEEARRANDFSRWSPALAELLALAR